MESQDANRDVPDVTKLRYWQGRVKKHPQLGNVVQYDPNSPFEELRLHNTILHLVVDGFYSIKNPVEVVALLLDHGANPNIQNDKGETPLHFVCQLTMRDPEIANLLLSHGADPRIQTRDGNRPFDFLGMYDRYSREIRTMLEEAVAKWSSDTSASQPQPEP